MSDELSASRTPYGTRIQFVSPVNMTEAEALKFANGGAEPAGGGRVLANDTTWLGVRKYVVLLYPISFPAKIQRALDECQTFFWTLDADKNFELRVVTWRSETGSDRSRRVWSDASTWQESHVMNARLIEAGAGLDPHQWEDLARRRFLDYGMPYCEGQEAQE